VVKELYGYFCENEEEFWTLYKKKPRDGETLDRAVCDLIAGMTDSYAISAYEKIFLPKRWQGDILSF
jgi:dGTPase